MNIHIRQPIQRSWPTLGRVLHFASALGAVCIGHSQAQVAFSVDYRSPIIGPTPITAADILVPGIAGGLPAYGPGLPFPLIFVPGGPAAVAGLGLPTYAACAGAPPGVMCPLELDALSFGFDAPVRPGAQLAGTYVFSVDEFALGIPGSPLAPNVLSEAAVGDSATDVFASLGLGMAPVPPGAFGGNSGIIDGNGTPSGTGAVYPGLGLFEPNMPLPPLGIDGDDLDALDINDTTMPFGAPVYFSLDAAFIDPLLGIPNTGSAMANGFMPGAVLVVPAPGAPPVVYVGPAMLGLDLMGAGSDDLDALALHENGIPGYQPAPGPYAWGPGMADMLLFSVRRGSAVVGMPDSLLGVPIAPGDILMPPPAAGMPPGIFIAAEALGLATTRTFGPGFAPFGGADLDALDTRSIPQTGLPYCFGTAAACPCGNFGAPGNGCANSTFAAGAHLAATGTASVGGDTVVLTSTNVPNGPMVYFQGTAQVAGVFGDGLRCVGGATIRLGVKMNAGNTSSYPSGADPLISIKGLIPAVGGTRFYQGWHRDAAVFCTAFTFNLTNALGVIWTP